MLLAMAAFHAAMASDWQNALDLADDYLLGGGREEPLYLATNLLVPGVLQQIDEPEMAQTRLKQFCDQTKTSWYLQICETLLDEQSEDALMEQAGTTPESILTAYTTLGFRAEARGDNNLALRYYREALGSYLDTWMEYNLALQRYITLRNHEKK